MNIGNTLQSYRKQIGLSQEDLAYKIGVSRQTVSKWERDECLPEIDKVMMLCDLFNITTDELLGRTENNSSAIAPKEKNITAPKKRKTGKIMLASGLVGIILSVLLTEVWALIDYAKGGSWYANKLVYLIRSPLAAVFFSAVAATIIGLIMVIRWKTRQTTDSTTSITNDKIKKFGLYAICASIALLVLIFLLSTFTDIFMIRLVNQQTSHADISGFFTPAAILVFIGGVYAFIAGITGKRKGKEPNIKGNQLLLKVSKKTTIISVIAFASSFLLAMLTLLIFEIWETIPFNYPLWLPIFTNLVQIVSLYSLAIGLVMMLVGFIGQRKQHS